MSSSLISSHRLPLKLGDKSFWRITLSLAIPIALQNMLAASFSLIDTLMVGQLGDLPLSATGMAGQWSWLFGMVLFGITSGAAVFVSQYWGDSNIKGIHRTIGIALSSGIILSILFFAVAILFPKTVMSIFNQDPLIIEQGSIYLKYACFSYPAIALSNILGGVLRSVERPRLPLLASGISAAFNALLNYILIFPAGLGVKGAAIATAISAWVAPILIIVVSLARKNILCAPMKDIFSFNGKSLLEFFRKASPVIINETMWGMGTVAYQIIFSNMGYEEYAALTIIKPFENFAFCFFLGLCNACCIMVGKEVGAGDIREAVRDTKRFLILMPLTSIIVGACIVILRSPLVSLFNFGHNISEYAITTAESVLIICGVWYIVRNIPYLTVVGIFRPGGDTTMGMIIELLVLWAFSVPMTFIAANVLNLPFITVYIIMYLCEDVPKAIIFLLYYKSGKWLKPVTEAGASALAELKAKSVNS